MSIFDDETWDDVRAWMLQEAHEDFKRDEEDARMDAEMEHEYGKPRDKEAP